MDKEQPFKSLGDDFLNLFTESGCIGDVGFTRYLDGSLNPGEIRLLEKHLLQCEPCLDLFGALVQVNRPEVLPEEQALCQAMPARSGRYMDLIKPARSEPAWRARLRSSGLSIFSRLASPRLAYGLVIGLGLVFAGLFLATRSHADRHARLYAEAKASLKSVSAFQTASNLRFIVALAEPRTERSQDPSAERGSAADESALDDALAYLSQALGSYPNYVPAYVGLGQVYLIKKQPEKAQKHFETALKLEAHQLEALNGLGIALFERAMTEPDPHTKDGLLQASVARFAQVLALNPRGLETLYNQARACYELGDKSKTLELIERYLAQDAKSRWAEHLSAVRDKLRMSNYTFFKRGVEEAFQASPPDRLAEIVSASPHTIWLIKRSLRAHLKLEVEGHFPDARREWSIALAVEHAYRRSTGDESYRPLIQFYSRLTGEQKQEKYRADCLAAEAFTHYQKGNLEESLRLSEAARPLYQELHDLWQIAFVYHLMGNYYFYSRSDYHRALAAYEAMASAAQRGRDHDALAQAFGNISVVQGTRGDYYAMKRSLEQMLNAAERVGSARHQAFALNGLGSLYRELGDWEASIRHYTQALALNRRMGDPKGQLENLEHIGLLYQRIKKFDKSTGFL